MKRQTSKSEEDNNPILRDDLIVHPYAAAYPVLEPKALKELCEDIRDHGQVEPIMLSDDLTMLCDGRNRLQACVVLGIEPRWETFSDWQKRTNVTHPSETYAIAALNNNRRQLTPSERARLANAMVKQLKEDLQGSNDPPVTLAEDRQNFAGVQGVVEQKGAGKATDADTDDAEQSKPMSGRQATAAAAEAHGVSESTINLMARLEKNRPDLYARVMAGELTVNGAVEELKVDLQEKQAKEKLAEMIQKLKDVGESAQFIEAYQRGDVLNSSHDCKEYVDLDETVRIHIRPLIMGGSWTFQQAKRFAAFTVNSESTVKELCELWKYRGNETLIEHVGGMIITIKPDPELPKKR